MAIFSPMYGKRRIDAVTPTRNGINADAYFWMGTSGKVEASTYNRWGRPPVYYQGESAEALAESCGVSPEMLAQLIP